MPIREKALILCADDYESILGGWKMLLESEGYEVLTAAESTAAMEQFISHPVDEVILDFGLPGMPGDVVAQQMKDQAARASPDALGRRPAAGRATGTS